MTTKAVMPPLPGENPIFDQIVQNYLAQHEEFLNIERQEMAEFLADAGDESWSVAATMTQWWQDRVQEIRTNLWVQWLERHEQAEHQHYRRQLRQERQRRRAAEEAARQEVAEANEVITQKDHELVQAKEELAQARAVIAQQDEVIAQQEQDRRELTESLQDAKAKQEALAGWMDSCTCTHQRRDDGQ